MQEPQYSISDSSVASQLAGKTAKLSVFSGDSTKKRGLIQTMGIQGQKCDAQSHRGNPEAGVNVFIMGSHGNLVQYMGPHAPSIRYNK